MSDVGFLLERLPRDISATSREGILALEEMIIADQIHDFRPITTEDLAQEYFPVKHYFADGVYAREIFLPAGTVIIGKIHKHAHMNVISQGKCTVITEFGIENIEAPHSFLSKAGTKRVVLTVEDVIWTTFHGVTEEQCGNLDTIEDRVICKNYDEYDEFAQQLIDSRNAKLN
jgi:hypothetical protein